MTDTITLNTEHYCDHPHKEQAIKEAGELLSCFKSGGGTLTLLREVDANDSVLLDIIRDAIAANDCRIIDSAKAVLEAIRRVSEHRAEPSADVVERVRLAIIRHYDGDMETFDDVEAALAAIAAMQPNKED